MTRNGKIIPAVSIEFDRSRRPEIIAKALWRMSKIQSFGRIARLSFLRSGGEKLFFGSAGAFAFLFSLVQRLADEYLDKSKFVMVHVFFFGESDDLRV